MHNSLEVNEYLVKAKLGVGTLLVVGPYVEALERVPCVSYWEVSLLMRGPCIKALERVPASRVGSRAL